MQRTNFPPIPLLPYDVPVYFLDQPINGMPRFLYDDRDIDYSALEAESMSMSSEESSESMEPSFSYGPDDLYLTIDVDTNSTGYVDLYLHGATLGNWQLLTKTNLTDTGPWAFREILFDDGSPNPLAFSIIRDDVLTNQFFRAVSGDAIVAIKTVGGSGSPAEPCSTNGTGQTGVFELDISPVPRALTIVYTISGSAINGIDYTNLSGSITVPANTSVANIYIEPLYDGAVEFDENVTLTLVLTNGYLVDPFNFTATETISDCTSNIFTVVATNVPGPIGIDYFAPSNSLVLSLNYFSGDPNNFALFDTNHHFTVWSGLQDVEDEVKIATVKKTVNGFTNWDMYFGSGTNVGWLSANGTTFNPTFCILTNSVVTNAQFLRGSLYVDQTGVWSNDVIAVTSDSVATSEPKGVWQINSSGIPKLVANISTLHLEGVITLTNDVAKWGPWAGKIITGDEDLHAIYAIDTNGITVPYNLGIDTEDFDIIPPNQDLYCVYHNASDSSILKLSQTLLTNYVGNLLITQAGEGNEAPKLFIVNWDGTNFATRAISGPTNIVGHFEHVTFAPINIPSL